MDIRSGSDKRMNNGRFGPIESDQKPKKTYRVDYNRLVTVLMIAVIIVLGIVIYMDAKKEPEEIYTFPMNVNADQSYVPQTEPTVRPFSPEEIRPLPEEEGFLPVFRIDRFLYRIKPYPEYVPADYRNS